MSDDLALIPTMALLDELQRRFEHIVFIGNAGHSKSEDSSTFRYVGNYTMLLGMAARIAHKVHQSMDDEGYEVDPENA